MAETIEIPVELTHFQFPEGVKDRLNSLLDRQDAGEILTQSERHEADGLVELMEFLSLIRLRAQQTSQ
jgi:ribosome assembly protein YihI (activator of Der GTPase)